MQPDTKTTVPASPEFPKDELLIFIGHSDDASTEANAILELQSEIEKDFRLLLKSNGYRSIFKRIRLWEWSLDALALTGGQERAVTPALDHAEIAIFVFRERVGKVTWQELEKARKGSMKSLHILAFFPENSPPQDKSLQHQAKLQSARDWATLLERQGELTMEWTNPDACSVTPCPTYQDAEELKTIVRDKVRIAIADILSVDITHPTAELSNNAGELRRYQGALKTELGTISLLGTHALENIPVTLTDTFVSLRISDTWRTDMRWNPKVSDESQQDERIRNPEEVVSLVFETCSLLLVIGDPGSGKTTLLKHYALSCLENEHYTTLGFKEPVLVFYLPLRELVKKGADYDSLPANLFAWSEKHSLGIADTLFFDWLHHRQTLLLLDGLDEISDPQQRIKACDWIDRIVTGFEKAKVVVTTRYTGYRKGDGIELRSRHVRADIMDFSPDQQKEFLEKWFMSVLCRELPPAAKTLQEWREEQAKKAAEKAATIIAFLEREENQSLRMLAAVPMLLQIMAILWKDRHYLPKTRSELYNAAVNYILDYRDRQKEIYPLLGAEDARRVLTPVSLWMQEDLEKDEADKALMQAEMQKHLKTLHQPPSVEKFCDNLIDRAGLLVAYGDKEYRFRHKSFREYMAGLQLEKKMHSNLGLLDKLVNNFGKDWWEEPLRFYIAEVDADAFDAFMAKLFDAEVSATLNQKQQDLLVTLINETRQIKTDALQKKLLDSATTTNRQRYIMQCLKAIGTTEAFDAVQRFLDAPFDKKAEALDVACEIAGVTGLPGGAGNRESCGAKASLIMDKAGAHYILIKGGTFTSSLTKKQETVEDIYVAKYTVTNKHYRQFINYLDSKEAGYAAILPVESYTKSLFSLAESIKDFSAYIREEKSLATRFRSPFDDDKKFNKDDQPVLRPSWYAARAYCLWLSLLESESGETNLYRLPTEKEWEYAAGGKESRKYPWGDKEPSPTLANYNNNEGATTPTGRYPEGTTPEGLHDMAGNVWEWTDDWYNNDEDYHAVRGGAYFSSNPTALRCSSRNNLYPWVNLYINVVGFRVIRSSLFSS
jgi:formylglycine-generating enzyme required for sulfatase activity/energy-coupling factor transporter ATP-binding protein EcfA2